MPPKIHPPAVTVRCPICEKLVAPVDGEYARHYVNGELCLGAKREIGQPEDRNGDR